MPDHLKRGYLKPMLSTPPQGGPLFVESLEQRIAPTGLVSYSNNPVDTNNPDIAYLTYSTAPAAGKLGFVPASSYGVTGAANLYAIALSGDGTSTTADNGSIVSTGDQIKIFSTDGYKSFLQIPKGQMVGFFQDVNGDNQVQTNELVGVALGKKTQVSVNGDVNGDIVTNLDASGQLSGSAGNAKQKIVGLNVVGNVTGNIISGGDISGVTVSGNVNSIYAGTAANGLVYDFAGPGLITGALTAPAPANKATGASITNVSVLSVTDRIQAGDGGLKAAGGSVSLLTFQADANGLTVLSGNGGGGKLATPGGAGGAIDSVTIKGAVDDSANSLILIQSGHGGDNAKAKAGPGGSISGIATSLDLPVSSGTIQQSFSLLNDNILIRAGAGGNGLKAGTGGTVENSTLYGSIQDDTTVTAGVANPEIQVLGGAGGLNTIPGPGSKSGKGGSISTVTVENLSTLASAQTSSILLQAGDAGVVAAGGKGKIGGDISGVSLLGTLLNVNAGNGSSATGIGGAGGNLADVRVLNLSNLFATGITLNAGIGGASTLNTGGAGGSINNFQVDDSDLAALTINDGAHGNGGAGQAGKGGLGGSVGNVLVNDSGAFRALPATVAVRSGTGGDGILGGGAGGDVNTLQILGSDFAYTVAAGNGGSVIAGGVGKGGAGGGLLTVGVSNQPASTTNVNFAAGSTGAVTAGNGGNGFGKGGAGGELSLVSLRATFDLSLTAGSGGSGATGVAGVGGAVAGSAGSSLFGAVKVASGNAGATGAAAGAGGAIDQFVAAAATSVSITSGNGTAGGAGGDITGSGTAFNSQTFAAPSGAVTVTAGNGSSANGVAGAGGSIVNFNGLIGLSGTTAFRAGQGGGGGGASNAAAAGGSLDQIKLTGPNGIGANPVTLTFDAGDGGTAGAAKAGGAGGSVTNVTLFNLATSTTVHHLAAGDGGSGFKSGGAGGTINEVHVAIAGEATGDIGLRSSAAFGYDPATGAGGLFAGVGGNGGKRGGLPGDVMNITANAIASIAAGKGATPQLAGIVDHILLNGLAASNADNTGAFTNFDTANFVGSVQNPTAAGASVYKTGDGLIAARSIGQIDPASNNRIFDANFRPEAELTLDAAGNVNLVDIQQPSLNPVVTPV